MIDDALSYPFDTGTDNIAAGSLLLCFSFFVVPFVLVSGYFVSVYRDSVTTTSSGPPEIPGMSLSQLLKDGIFYLSIICIYFLLPIVLLGAFTSIAEGGMLNDLLRHLSVASFIIAGSMIPAAVLNALENETLRAAFHLSDVVRIVATDRYLLTIGLLFLVWTGFLFILTVLSIMIVIGWILIPVACFYTGIVIHRMFGNAYSATRPSPEPA